MYNAIQKESIFIILHCFVIGAYVLNVARSKDKVNRKMGWYTALLHTLVYFEQKYIIMLMYEITRKLCYSKDDRAMRAI